MDKPSADLVRMDLLIRHELLLAELYELFASRSSSYESFWREMIENERRHAAWLNRLKNWMIEDGGRMIPDRFPKAAIETSILYLENQISEVKRDGVPSNKSFAIAVNIENAMIESKFFTVFQSKNAQFNEMIGKIIEETKLHLQKIRKMMN